MLTILLYPQIGAIDDICAISLCIVIQQFNSIWSYGIICIQMIEVSSLCLLYNSVTCTTQTSVLRLSYNTDIFTARVGLLIFTDNVHRAVCAAVIKHQEFNALKCLCQSRIHCQSDVFFDIINRYTYRNFIIHGAKVTKKNKQ